MYSECPVILLQNKIFSGYFVKMSDNKILIQCEQNENLSLHNPATLYIYHDIKGEIIYDAKVGTILTDKIVLTDCIIKEVKQKRSETRVDVEMSIQVNKINMGLNQLALNKTIPVKAVNLSASGIKLLSPLDLPMEIVFFLTLPLIDEKITVEALIVRKEKEAKEFNYGCRFVNMTQANMAKIRSFVFANQIKQKIKQQKSI